MDHSVDNSPDIDRCERAVGNSMVIHTHAHTLRNCPQPVDNGDSGLESVGFSEVRGINLLAIQGRRTVSRDPRANYFNNLNLDS